MTWRGELTSDLEAEEAGEAAAGMGMGAAEEAGDMPAGGPPYPGGPGPGPSGPGLGPGFIYTPAPPPAPGILSGGSQPLGSRPVPVSTRVWRPHSGASVAAAAALSPAPDAVSQLRLLDAAAAELVGAELERQVDRAVAGPNAPVRGTCGCVGVWVGV